jgi:hypothetical protein
MCAMCVQTREGGMRRPNCSKSRSKVYSSRHGDVDNDKYYNVSADSKSDKETERPLVCAASAPQRVSGII